MSLGLLYWILLLLMLVGGIYTNRTKPAEAVPGLVLWIALLVIGIAVFGGPIK